MARYQHRQSNLLLPVIVVAPLVMVFVILLFSSSGGAAPTLAGVMIGLAVVAAAFSALETEVTDAEITTRFRFGWPRRRIPVAAITGHQAVRNRWWYGLGLRLIPGGWMYNVWGLDAVEIRYEDERIGPTKFRIGTDDQAGLVEAITEVTGRPATSG